LYQRRKNEQKNIAVIRKYYKYVKINLLSDNSRKKQVDKRDRKLYIKK